MQAELIRSYKWWRGPGFLWGVGMVVPFLLSEKTNSDPGSPKDPSTGCQDTLEHIRPGPSSLRWHTNVSSSPLQVLDHVAVTLSEQSYCHGQTASVSDCSQPGPCLHSK